MFVTRQKIQKDAKHSADHSGAMIKGCFVKFLYFLPLPAGPWQILPKTSIKTCRPMLPASNEYFDEFLGKIFHTANIMIPYGAGS